MLAGASSRVLWDLRSRHNHFKTGTQRFLCAVGLLLYKLQTAFDYNIVINYVGAWKKIASGGRDVKNIFWTKEGQQKKNIDIENNHSCFKDNMAFFVLTSVNSLWVGLEGSRG